MIVIDTAVALCALAAFGISAWTHNFAAAAWALAAFFAYLRLLDKEK